VANIMLMRSSLCLSTVLMLCACAGSAAGGAHVESPFTDADAKLFEDGVDFLADPDALAGRWAVDWETEMRGRVAASDLLAVVTVTALRTDIDPQQRTTYRLVAKASDVWKGQAPSDDLSLSVSQDAVGFSSVDGDRGRILNQQFLVFVKWYVNPSGTVSAHWHLSTASALVLTRVRAHLERQTPSHRTIIKRTVHSS
jgi:hypothetical protein